MKVSERMKKVLSVILTLCMVFSYVPAPVNAADCTHHTQHTEACGYAEGESDCAYHCHICHVQELVDALPGDVTAENAEAVAAQLSAISTAMAELSEEELAQVDFAKYTAAAEALAVLNGAEPVLDDGNTYTVTVAEGIENGTVTVECTEAEEGATVALTVTPAEGWELDSLRVMKGEEAVAVTDNTFIMPAGNVTVSAAFKAVVPPCTHENKSCTDNGDGTHTIACTCGGYSETVDHTYADGKCVCGAEAAPVEKDNTRTIDSIVADVTIAGETTPYSTLQDAIAAVQNATADQNAKVTLRQNVDLGNEYITISGGVFTLDFGAYTITSANGADRTGVLTITNGTVTIDATTGGILGTSTTNNNVIYQNEGTLTINGGTFTGTTQRVLYVYGSRATAIINGGTFASASNDGIYLSSSKLTVNGGSVKGSSYALNNYQGTATVNGGTFTATASEGIAAYSGNKLYITGGTFIGYHGLYTFSSYSECVVSGGVFQATYDIYDGVIKLKVADGKESGASFPGGLNIRSTTLGAVLDSASAAYWIGDTMIYHDATAKELSCAADASVEIRKPCTHSSLGEDATWTDLGNGMHGADCSDCNAQARYYHTYTSSGSCDTCAASAVIVVTTAESTAYFASLQDALNSVQTAVAADNAVVKLMQNVDLGVTNATVSGGIFTLDLNGQVLTSAATSYGTLYQVGGEVTVTDTSSAKTGTINTDGNNSYCIYQAKNTVLTINGGTFSKTVYGAVMLLYGSTVTINDGSFAEKIYFDSNNTVTINGGTFKSTEFDNSTATINGGVFKGVVYSDTKATVVITGGTFDAYTDLRKYGTGTITLKLAEGKTEGASFPGGISLQDCMLADILGEGAAYWIGDRMYAPSSTEQKITCEATESIVIKAPCTHSTLDTTTIQWQDDGVGSHYTECPACQAAVRENHIFTDSAVCDVCKLTAAAASATVGSTTTYHKFVAEALLAVSGATGADSAKVTLLRDVDMKTEVLTVTGGVFTLDLGTYTLKGSASNIGLLTVRGGDVTIIGTTGQLRSEGSGQYALRVDDKSKVTVAGGTISSESYGVSVADYEAVVNITGGTITADNIAVMLSDGSVTVTGGTLEGNNACWTMSNSGSLAINGGTVKGQLWVDGVKRLQLGVDATTGVGASFPDGVTVEDGQLADLLIRDANGIATTAFWIGEKMIDPAPGEITLSGSVVIKKACPHTELDETASWNDDGVGNHYQTCPTCQAALRSPHEMGADGYCSGCNLLVAKASVKVGETVTLYKTLEEAVAIASQAQNTGAVVTLLNDVNLGAKQLRITSGTFTLDLADHTITSQYKDSPYGTVYMSGGNVTITGTTGAITNSASYSNYAIQCRGTLTINGGIITDLYINSSGANVTINGGTINGKNGVYIYSSGANVTINGGTFNGTNGVTASSGGAVTINGGKFSTKTYCVYASGSAATVTINGGEFNSNSYGIYVSGSTTVTINDGVFSTKSNFVYASSSEANVNIYGGSIQANSDFYIYKGTVQLKLAEGKTEGASFPGGLSISGGSKKLQDLLGSDCAYWIGSKMQTVTATATSLTCGSNESVVIKAVCKHTGEKTYTDKNNGTHDVTCTACGTLLTSGENCTFGDYAQKDNKIHSRACELCGRTETGNHDFASNGGVCSSCSAVCAHDTKNAEGNCDSCGYNPITFFSVHGDTEWTYDPDHEVELTAVYELKNGYAATTVVYKIDGDSTEYDEGTFVIAKGWDANTYNRTVVVNVDGFFRTFGMTFTVNKADPTVTVPTGHTATYGQTLADVALTAAAGDTAGKWTWDAGDTTSVGDVGANKFFATFTPNNTQNYNTKTVELTVQVNHASIENAEVTVAGTHTYTGAAIEPAVTVTLAGFDKLDYTVSYANNTNAGTATVTVTGKGNFTGNVTKTFVIAKAEAPDITFPKASGIFYGDTLAEAALEFTSNEFGTFAWADATTKPEAKGEFDLYFYPTDVNNYDWTKVSGWDADKNGVCAKVEVEVDLKPGTGSVTIAGWTYGDTANDPVPVSDTNGIDHVTYLYKVQGADDSTYTAEVPVAAGAYTVKATFAKTAYYTEAVATADFTIAKADAPDITFPKVQSGIFYGDTLAEVALEFTSNGFGTFAWADATTKPEAKGEFDLYFYPTDVNNYDWAKVSGWDADKNGICVKVEVEVDLKPGTGSVTIAGWTYGDTANDPVPVSDTNGTDHVTYLYKVQGADDSTYTAEVPVAAGVYTVKATFAKTAYCTEAVATADFTIAKADAPDITFPMASGIFYGDSLAEAALEFTSNEFGTFAWADAATKPEAKGEFDLYFYPTDVNNYDWAKVSGWDADKNGFCAKVEVEVDLKPGTGSVTIAGWTYGDTANDPVPVSDTNGTDHVTYLYKVQGADDSTYTAEVPVAAGAYTVKATFAKTAYYTEAVVTADFTIAKRAIAVAAKDQTIRYGETISTTEYTVTGLTSTDTVEITLTASTANVTYEGVIAVDDVKIFDGGVDVSVNYEIDCVNGDLVIEPDDSKINGLTTENVNSADQADIKAVQDMMDNADSVKNEWKSISETCKALMEKIEEVAAEISRIETAVSKYTLDNVKSSDKNAITKLLSDIEALLATDNLTDAERTALEGYKTKCQNLLAEIDSTEALIAQLEETVDEADAETVKSTDKAALEQVIEDIETLLNSGNVTDEEAALLNQLQKDAEELVQVIDDTAEAKKEAADQAATYDAETVNSADKADLEQLVEDIEALLDTKNLTDNEREALEETLEEIGELIEIVEATADDAKEATDAIGEQDDATVTSADKAALEQAIDAIDELLAADNLTDEEREALEAAKADAEDMLATVAAAQAAAATDNIKKVASVTAEIVKAENKKDLEAAKTDLEKALKDYGANYTEAEKTALQTKLQTVNNALQALKNAETVAAAIAQLPETVETDDEEAAVKILAAKAGYDALTGNEKSLVGDAAKKKLESLVATLTAYDIIKGDGGGWSKGTNGTLSFTANGPFSKFIELEVDGKAVDAKNYDAKSGSTIITLKKSYLDTLAVGEHTITVVYVDGETTGTFKIQPKPSTPATGDDFNVVLWTSAMAVSLAAIAVLLVGKKKGRYAK